MNGAGCRQTEAVGLEVRDSGPLRRGQVELSQREREPMQYLRRANKCDMKKTLGGCPFREIQ